MRGIILLLAGCATVAAAGENPALFQAIRNGDMAYLKSHLTPASRDTRDGHGTTLLMYAAVFGNIQTLKLLFDAGANVNARNDFDATALLWAARDPVRASQLIEHGADINAQSKQGRTPLMLASLLDGGWPVVAMLLNRGAKVNTEDGHGDTALGLAASIGAVETMRLLLARGADPKVPNKKGEPPIILATKSKSAGAVRLLLEAGVDANVANTSYPSVRNGPIPMVGLTPLHRAAAFGPVETVRDLLRAGAKVDARDARGLTPLIFSCATEYASDDIVRALLAAGADVSLTDSTGQSALDWAEKFGDASIIAELQKAGAKAHTDYQQPKQPETPAPKASEALARSIALLEHSSGEFFRQSGCVGCHHQPLVARAQHAARGARLPVDEVAAREQTAQMKGQWLASQEGFLQSIMQGGGPNRLAEDLLGLAAAGLTPDLITDSAVLCLAEAQASDGSFPAGEEQPRPPMNESAIAATARAIGAIRAYSIPARRSDFEARIARARVWLRNSKPANTGDFAMRLLGLSWSDAPKAEADAAVRALVSLQHDDGGWADNPHLKSNAFATGQALIALAESGVSPSAPAYRRGVEYLLLTQFPDGSWYVRSRAIKFQPYFESGFPFGDDQWISAAATGWAAQAIAYAIAPKALHTPAHLLGDERSR